MKKHVVSLAGAVAVVGAFSLAVFAQTPPADRAIKYRQGVMTAQGWHMGILGGMAKGERPYDKDTAVRSAMFVEELIKMPWEGFPPGSDQGAPTKAKAEIWKDPAKFKQRADAAMAEAPKLVAAAKTGELSQLRSAIGPMGNACNNCHDDFRSK